MAVPPEIRLSLQLRWRDMDMLGHLNQSVYHELIEEGRGALITQVAQASGTPLEHGAFVLVRVELDYRHEVRHADREIEIVVRVAHVGRSSIAMDHEVCLRDGTVAAAGRSVLVGWDPAARGKRTLAAAEREALGA